MPLDLFPNVPSKKQSYITVNSETTLPNERVLLPGDGLTYSDGGAGGYFNVAVDGSVLRTGADISVNSLYSTTTITAGGAITGSNLSGTNTGNQTITLTGDVTGSGTGSFAATIANNSVSLAKMATMATASLLGRNTAGTGNVEVLSATTAKTLLSLNNVQNTALTTWTGTTTLVTVGTIATGTWNATTIAVGKGGTGTSTAFTTGSVVYAGASGVYSQDNSNFFWDATNHRLGLGTTSPNQQLELTGSIRLAASTATTPSAIYLGATKYFHTYGETSSESTNMFIGPSSGNTSLTRGTAIRNIAIGRICLASLTTGSYNLAWGDQCGRFIDSGQYNAMIGDTAGYSMTSGSFNLAIGPAAVYSCTTSSGNIGVGQGAAAGVTTNANGNNVAIGNNSVRAGNVAFSVGIGAAALSSRTNGTQNELTGSSNIAIGFGAQSEYCTPGLGVITGGISQAITRSIAIGYYACCSVSNGCVLGLWSDTSTFGGVGTHAPAAQWHTRANRAGQTALIADGFTSPTVDIAQFRTTADGSIAGSGSGTWTTQFAVNKTGGLSHKVASNSMAGSATLVAGTVTVTNTSVATGDVIEFSRQSTNSSTALGHLFVSALTNATSFVITAKKADMSGTETGDTSIVWWRIVRPI